MCFNAWGTDLCLGGFVVIIQTYNAPEITKNKSVKQPTSHAKLSLFHTNLQIVLTFFKSLSPGSMHEKWNALEQLPQLSTHSPRSFCVAQASQDRHSSQNHLLPRVTSTERGGTNSESPLAHLLCSDMPHPLQELSGSGPPAGPFVSVPRHSTHTVFVDFCKKKHQFIIRVTISKNHALNKPLQEFHCRLCLFFLGSLIFS